MEKQKEDKKLIKFKLNKRGITLVALVVTIVVLIILATISINIIFGEEGIVERTKQAKQETVNAQVEEEQKLAEAANTMEQNIKGEREQVTLDKEEYDTLLSRIEALEAKTTPKVLWTGSSTSGTLQLTDSIYNYRYLIFKFDGSISSIVPIDKSGMNTIRAGFSTAAVASNSAIYGGLYISDISEDGKTLKLVRSGYGTWTSIAITEIQGIL